MPVSAYTARFLARLLTPALGVAVALSACTADRADPRPPGTPPLEVIDHAGRPRPPFAFSTDDAAFLNGVQRGAFRYLWEVADPATGMVFDRTSVKVVSIAGVGFQLSGIPVGVERGWITRDQGNERALRILSSLQAEPTNRRNGLFFHYLQPGSARPTTNQYETVVSTIDSAILLAGMITVSSYFGGDVARRADAMVAEADWRSFVAENPPESWARGLITLGWRAKDSKLPGGDGSLLPYYWADAGDEQKLVTFLAVSVPDESKGVPPETYYRLRRQLGSYADSGPFVWFPWSGALFTHFFAHCWIGYAAIAPDDPEAFGISRRPRVDWWENSRRAVVMQRAKAIANPRALPGFGPDAWGIGANDSPKGYSVAHLFPNPIPWPGALAGIDDPKFPVKDDWADGSIAPYNAGSAIMFEADLAVRALRHYASLSNPGGAVPRLWSDPGSGGIGFQDAFHPGSGWVAPDCVAIDEGPLLLAIENARTGLIWRLFHDHPTARSGVARLGLRLDREALGHPHAPGKSAPPP